LCCFGWFWDDQNLQLFFHTRRHYIIHIFFLKFKLQQRSQYIYRLYILPNWNLHLLYIATRFRYWKTLQHLTINNIILNYIKTSTQNKTKNRSACSMIVEKKLISINTLQIYRLHKLINHVFHFNIKFHIGANIIILDTVKYNKFINNWFAYYFKDVVWKFQDNDNLHVTCAELCGIYTNL